MITWQALHGQYRKLIEGKTVWHSGGVWKKLADWINEEIERQKEDQKPERHRWEK